MLRDRLALAFRIVGAVAGFAIIVAAFLLLPCIVGLLVFQELILTPAFLGWLVLIIVASAICWNRGSAKPQLWSTDAR